MLLRSWTRTAAAGLRRRRTVWHPATAALARALPRSGCASGGGGGTVKWHSDGAASTAGSGDSTASASSAATVAAERKNSIPAEFWQDIKAIHDADIQALNSRLFGPVDKYSDTVTQLPFVFCLGNHSSGKSSFINYMLGRPVQNTGVAPTDDSFTIIAPGPADVNQDGASVVGDVDFGFSGLRRFGLQLLNHLSLKVRTDTKVSDVMIIDSPGMIDNPAGRYGGSEESRNMDRGYDFPEVTKWLAARADVVLLFFDPDKPGTTGETLACMTHSLKGVEHKLHIILNKADQFEKMHDFARAYGALCWNLAKVIPRKDLPRIYTMCLPVEGQRVGGYLLDQPEFAVAMAGGSLLLGVGTFLGLAPTKQRRLEELTSEEGLDQIFRRAYHRDIANGNEFVQSLWDRARPCIQSAIDTVGVPTLRSHLASNKEMARLREICDVDVPRLRKTVAPDVNAM